MSEKIDEILRYYGNFVENKFVLDEKYAQLPEITKQQAEQQIQSLIDEAVKKERERILDRDKIIATILLGTIAKIKELSKGEEE